MAITAVCEQLSLELESMGKAAAHISPHSLHPTVAATNFLSGRNAEGEMKDVDGAVKKMFVASGDGLMTTADDIIDGLFKGLDDGKHYVIVDNPSDVPTSQQIQMRMGDMVNGQRPRAPEQLGMLLKMADPTAFKKRMETSGAAGLKSKL